MEKQSTQAGLIDSEAVIAAMYKRNPNWDLEGRHMAVLLALDCASKLLAAPAAPAPKDCFATGECSNVIHHCRDLPNCEPKARMKAASADPAQADGLSKDQP